MLIGLELLFFSYCGTPGYYTLLLLTWRWMQFVLLEIW